MRLRELALLLLCSVCGCQQTTVSDSDGTDASTVGRRPESHLAPREDAIVVAADDTVTLRYALPMRTGKPASSAAKWGLAAPIIDGDANPNRIVYDLAYLEAYLHWAVDAPTACGAATYQIRMEASVEEFTSGLDAAYLGRQFQERDLLRYLQERVEGKRSEQTFQIQDAAACQAIREYPDSLVQRLRQSPWERDTLAVIGLLGESRCRAAQPWLQRLIRDESPTVRGAAVSALGSIGRGVPKALDDVQALLEDDELRAAAFDALRRAEGAAVPILIAALDHDHALVRNQAVYSLPWIPFHDAAPAILAALQHEDQEVRQWAVAVVLDIQSRGVVIDHAQVISALKSLVENAEEPAATRQNAEIAVANLTE